MFILFFLVFIVLTAMCVSSLENIGSFTPIPLDLTVQNPYPGNNSVNIPLNVTVTIDVSSISGSVMNLSWYENTSGTWLLVQQNLSIFNGTYSYYFANASNYSTVYWWRVCANDGLGNFNNKTFCFRTLSFIPLLSISNVYPADGSIINSFVPTLYFNITHRDGGLMNYTVYWNGTSEIITRVFDVSNSTRYHPFVNATSYGSYNWSVHLNNGTSWCNESFVFTISNVTGGILNKQDMGIIMAFGGGFLVFGLFLGVIIFKKHKKNKYGNGGVYY